MAVVSGADLTGTGSWSRLFEGVPSGIRDDNLRGTPLPFLKWIRGYPRCQKEMESLWASLADYDQKFRAGDEKSAEKIYSQIFRSMDATSSPSCADALRRTYYVGAVSMGPSYKGGDGFYRDDLVLMVILLANKNVIHFLTPELRHKMADGKKSLWTAQKNGDYLLSGVYRCQNSQIYLSSSLRPFNLAASLAHEIDHLYRDKTGFRFMWDWINNKDVRSFVISDEILASLYGALYQRNLFLLDKESGSTVDYTTQGDEFNLFQKNGPLSQLMDFTHLRPPIPFFEFHGLIAQKKNDPWVKGKLCEVDKTIRAGYFAQIKGSCNLEGIFPKSTWFTTESYISQLRRLRRDPGQFNNYLLELETWEEALVRPSPVCSAMIEAEDRGDLKDYIGSQLEDQGGHTGNSGVKPCLRVKY